MAAMKKCAKCGYDNDPRVRFCDLCKQKFDTPTGVIKPVAVPEGFAFSSAPRRRGEVIPDFERRYVVLPAGPPITLAVGTPAMIGRDEGAAIKLASSKVSRQHAELRWHGDVLFVCDLGSQNGTCVNGEKLPSKGMRELKNKDEIDVGGVPVVYRILPPGVPESQLDVGAATTEAALDARDAIAGKVDIVPLGTILERLATLGATGMLRVETSAAQGQLRIESGKPVFGSFGNQVGDAAIATITQLVDGRFRFDRET